MKQLVILLFGLMLLGCNSENKSANNIAVAETVIADVQNNENTINVLLEKPSETPFNFTNFKIGKGQLGKIKIGMTIEEAEKQFTGLTKKVDEATSFGFGGGSPAYLYYLGDELVFGLIPELETDTLLFIVAIHKNLQTTNGLNPKSSVSNLLEKYPNLTVQEDLMNDWEYFQDKKNNWDFIFMTDEDTQIGEYPELNAISKPKRLTTKADWLTIK